MGRNVTRCSSVTVQPPEGLVTCSHRQESILGVTRRVGVLAHGLVGTCACWRTHANAGREVLQGRQGQDGRSVASGHEHEVPSPQHPLLLLRGPFPRPAPLS